MAREISVITFAAVVLAAAFVFSCSSGDDGGTEVSSSSYWYRSSSSVWDGETFKDSRDGRIYKIVNYGEDNIWFVEYLYLYMNNYYTSKEAMVACPIGWRLPNVEEFNNFISLISEEQKEYFTYKTWWTFSEEEFFGIKFKEIGYTRIPENSHSVLCKECLSSNNCYYGAVYGDDLIDDRDSQNPQTYKTVIIGTQTWMARNLNYNVSGSRCYNDNTTYCDKYGRLYSWATAIDIPSICNTAICHPPLPNQGICPNGWHLPSREEWTTLVNYASKRGESGRILKNNSWPWMGMAWRDANIDFYGFSALPGGDYWDFYGRFDLEYHSGSWWTASENGKNAYIFYMSIEFDYVNYLDPSKSNLYSVRCVKD